MSSIVKKLEKQGHFTPEHPFVTDTIYEVIMGSMAYGVSSNSSDMDVYAVCVPERSMVFPHLTGAIPGFGPPPKLFEVQQKHHMLMNQKEYDVNIYGIVKYFQLCAENNPNMIDSLFVPDRCVLYKSDVGDHMRVHRRLFLSKRIYDKMRGYAKSELSKIKKGKTYSLETNPKRAELTEKYGYDVKSAYHVVRLMLEAEMVLNEGDLDIEYHRETLKFVREGGYTMDELIEWFHAKEIAMDKIHADSNIPLMANFDRLRVLLYECLEMHFGTLKVAESVGLRSVEAMEKIARIVESYQQ